MLGTGNALAARCYNTCFTLHDPSGEILLVDAGGGNGILTQLERAEIDLRSIHHLFITHTHTDHLLGAVWVIHSTKELQYGFVATMPDGKRLCCLGDEPYNPMCRSYAEGVDAQSVFSGTVLVPDDLERIEL